MDASLLRMVTRDMDVPKVLTDDCAFIDKSRRMFEADGRCETPLDLFSGISEILLTVNRYQPRLRPNPLSLERMPMSDECVQTLDRPLTITLGPI